MGSQEMDARWTSGRHRGEAGRLSLGSGLTSLGNSTTWIMAPSLDTTSGAAISGIGGTAYVPTGTRKTSTMITSMCPTSIPELAPVVQLLVVVVVGLVQLVQAIALYTMIRRMASG